MLEGNGKATLPNGKTVRVKEGQLVFVLPGRNEFGPLLDINLEKLVAGSRLVNGFSTPLSSRTLINEAISKQKKKLAHGGAEDTGVTPESFIGGNGVGNGLACGTSNCWNRCRRLWLPYAFIGRSFSASRNGAMASLISASSRARTRRADEACRSVMTRSPVPAS